MAAVPGTSAHRQGSPDEGADEPQIWSLGSGSGSAALAARHGLRFGYSLFHSDSVGDPAIPDLYRSRFAPPASGGRPYVAVAVAGVCAETDERARSLAARHANPFVRPTVVGSPSTCRAKLTAIVRRHRADEIVFTSLRLPYEERVASFRALAEEWGVAHLFN